MANAPPHIGGVKGNFSAFVGDPVELWAEVVDPEGQALSVHVVAFPPEGVTEPNVILELTGPDQLNIFRGTLPDGFRTPGDWQLLYMAKDSAGNVADRPIVVTVRVAPMLDLGTRGGTTSRANGINNHGQVVGSYETASGGTHAFLWQSGGMTDLGTLGGSFSVASGINNHGQVVGASETASGETHAFLWQSGGMTDLGTLGGTESVALAINNLGQVVGRSRTALGKTHAFLWQSGGMTDLGTLGGTESVARGINDLGQVVGTSTPASGPRCMPSSGRAVW